MIDPFDLIISDGVSSSVTVSGKTYTSGGSRATVGWSAINTALGAEGATVIIQSGGSSATQVGDVTFNSAAQNYLFNFDGVGNIKSTLKINAHGDIKFSDKINGLSASTTNNNRLNLEFTAGGDIDLNKVAISTNGGYFTATAKGTQKLFSNPDVLAAGDFKAADATISTYAAFGGGDILINAKGKADLGAMDFSYDYRNGNEFKLTQVGSINVTAGSTIILNKEFDFNDSGGYAADGTANAISDRTALTFTAGDSITLNGSIIDKEYGDGRDALGINLTAGTGSVTINQPIYTSGGSVVISGNGINQNALINTDRANERTTVEQANGKNGNATRSEGGDVTLSSDTALALNAITTDSFCADGKCTGNLVVQSRTTGKNIDITQTDNTFLKIHGTTDFIINGGTLNLTNGLNIFGTQGGSVEEQAGNAVSKTITLGKTGNTTVNGFSLLLGAADINGTARLTATSPTASVNSITQAANSKLTITGNTELTADTITLDHDGNDFATITSIDAATSAHISDINSVDFNTLKTANLTLNTQADVHFNGPIATQDKAVAITQKGTGAVALADGLTQTGTGVVTFKGTALSGGLQYLGEQNTVWNLAEKALVWSGKTVGFAGFSRLIGGDGVDTVSLSEAVTAIDLANQNSTGFALSNMEVIKATAANTSLKGFKANSQWTIIDDKKGTIVQAGGRPTAFEGFNELISSDDSANSDTFIFNSAGAVGKITGQNADVVNLFTGADGAGVDYDWAVTANTLNGFTTASTQVKRSGQSTDVISALTGVGTINSSNGKDTVSASATYAGTIDLKAGVNALTTDSASLLFSSSPLKMNGFVGVNGLNAKTQAATLTATTDNASATLAWTVNPAEDALKGPLSGSITYAQTGQADQTLNFNRFALLSGGANNDTFTLNAGTFTGGQINAGTPGSTATQDRLINAVDGTLWDLTAASLRGVTFSGFNYWQGSGTDTVNGMNATNNWVMNAGHFTLNTATQLSGFNAVNGGSGKDIFTITANTSGITLRGNAGADEFILADSRIQTGTLDGGAGVGVDSENDTLKINSGTNSGTNSSTNAWVVTAPKTGTVNGNHFSGMEILAYDEITSTLAET
ncbi:MAG TPA: hypothetical protein PKD17_10270, partial [Cellvibrionaceae bacterium]|nr:hypothetical protein [Cellvibrionaceae bacterium]